MISRFPFRSLALAVTIAVSMSACATFSNTDVVADVDGTELSADRFETMSTTFFERNVEFGTAPPVQGRVDAEASRFLLTALVNQALLRGFLDGQNVDITEERAAVRRISIEPSPLGDLDDDFLDLVADLDADLRTEAFGKVSAPNIDQLRTMYVSNPSSTGVTCVRHILVETRVDADAIVDELADGADFATLAEERSTDPSAIGGGGAITGQGNECLPLEAVLRGFDPGFAAGVLDAIVGVPTGPVESSFGWHVILHRPWVEIGESVGALHQPFESGKLLFDGYAATADVDVDPRYGWWNTLGGAVEAIG